MEALQLLWLALATVVFVAVLLRSTRHAPYTLLQPTVEVSDPDIARRMLFDHADAFSNRPTKPFPLDFAVGRHHSISTKPYGPAWSVLRRSITAGTLHPTRLVLLEQAQREAVDSFVAGLYAAQRGASATASEVVVRGCLRHAIYTLMTRICFGEGALDEPEVRAIDRAQMEFLLAYGGTKAVEATWLPRVLYLRRWLRLDAAFNRLSYLMYTHIVAARRRWTERGCSSAGCSFTPYVDSLFVLRVPADDAAAGERRGRLLTDAEMAPIVWEFILAGTETVACSVEWVLAHLAARPDVQNKVRREVVATQEEHHLRSTPPYLRAVILECLRMHPALPSIMREVSTEAAAATAVVGGATVADGATMHFKLNACDIGRSREAWTEPDEFRPERFLAGGEGEGLALVPGPKEVKMMPFGAGRRYCPGAGLGMLHIGCFVAAAVREFDWAPPAKAGGSGVDFTEMDIFFNVMKTPLRARITPCSKT